MPIITNKKEDINLKRNKEGCMRGRKEKGKMLWLYYYKKLKIKKIFLITKIKAAFNSFKIPNVNSLFCVFYTVCGSYFINFKLHLVSSL